MSENAMVPLSELGIVHQDDKIFSQVAGGDFLPRIMLMQGSSEQVKEGKIGQGHLALVVDKNNPQDLGEMFDALLIHWRPKAMRLEGGDIVEDVYSVEDPTFQQIKVDSESKEEGVSAMYGPEYLVYLVAEKKFATFFYSNPTLRREGGTTKGLMGQCVTFEKKLIKQNSRSWFGIKVYPSKTPHEMPSVDEMKAEVQKFQNPPVRKREQAPQGRAR